MATQYHQLKSAPFFHPPAIRGTVYLIPLYPSCIRGTVYLIPLRIRGTVYLIPFYPSCIIRGQHT